MRPASRLLPELFPKSTGDRDSGIAVKSAAQSLENSNSPKICFMAWSLVDSLATFREFDLFALRKASCCRQTFSFYSLFPVQQTMSEIGCRVLK